MNKALFNSIQFNSIKSNQMICIIRALGDGVGKGGGAVMVGGACDGKRKGRHSRGKNPREKKTLKKQPYENEPTPVPRLTQFNRIQSKSIDMTLFINANQIK